MRRASYTRPSSGSLMTPLRVSNRDNVQSSGARARRSSSTTRTSTGTSSGPAVKRPKMQKNFPNPLAPRRSSIFGNGRLENGPMKDPRPLGDRNYRDKCIRKIVEFLSSEGYPHKVTPRTLATPNTKDVVHIYNFLFTYMDPDYAGKGKPEEEIPRMLSMLDYPFQLSRNHMFTVAAQHSWPHVLGGLMWLVDSILSVRNIDVTAVMFPRADDFCESEKEILCMHLTSSYLDYLSGTDDFTPHEELLKQKLKDRWNQDGNCVDKLKEKNRRLREQLDEMKSDPDTLESRQERVSMIERDIESHKRYVQQMNAVHDQLVKKVGAMEQLLESLNTELQKIDQERQDKQRIIETQGVSPADVLRMNAQMHELAAQIRLLEEQNSQLNDQVCDAEIKLCRKREASDGRRVEVNSMVKKCFPAEDSDRLQLDRGANVPQITSWLQNIAVEVRSRVHRAEADRDKSKYKLEMCQQKEDCRQKDLQVKQSASKTLCDQYDRFMKDEREEMDKIQAVLDDLQQQIDVVMATTAGDDDSAAVDKVTRQCDERVQAAKKINEKYAEFLLQAVAVAADHKCEMREVFKKVNSLASDPRCQPRTRTSDDTNTKSNVEKKE